MAKILQNFGLTNSIVLKNIKAKYIPPLTQLEYEENIKDLDINELSLNELLELKPKNWNDEGEKAYLQETYFTIWGKDGQTNAYVKRGLDTEEVEYAETQLTNSYTWHFLTDDKIDIKPSGKLIAKGREWFIVKVISQETIGTEQNKFNAMSLDPLSDRHKLFGQKLLVLI